MKDFKFDIFQWGRFKCSMKLRFPKDWIFSEKDIIEGIEAKYPSLKGQEYTLACTWLHFVSFTSFSYTDALADGVNHRQNTAYDDTSNGNEVQLHSIRFINRAIGSTPT